MRIYLQAFVVTLIAAGLLVFGFKTWRDASLPKEAEQRVLSMEEMEKAGLPDFSSETIQGEKFSLHDFKGKIVVLSFWASWCGPCVEEFPSMLKLAEAMKGDLILVAISGDSEKEDIDRFMKQLDGWDKPWVKVAWDKDAHIMNQYQVNRLPESFIAGTRMQLIRKVVGSINWHTPESEQYLQEILKR